ncbi:BamA/TamA family outer membrane protein, partial [bacterium]|nr:BamA/TamA family outer membrane protein [bacterium]
CQGSDSCGNTSFPFSAGWANDSKDSAILPTKGALQRANYEISPLGDIKYNKATYQHQLFFSVTKGAVLMLNGEAGIAKGLSGQALPYYRNFFAGGSGSVRGYDTASLGPYEISTVTGSPVRLGGTRRFIFNAELSLPTPGFGNDKSVRFGPFFDAGQVYGDKDSQSTTAHPEGPIRMSTGLAATWISPFGPLKFSFAQPLNKQENDKLQRFQFQMGQAF